MITDVVVVHQDHLMDVRVIQDVGMIHIIVMVVEVVVVN
jgi:hypothetical protein